MHGTKTPSTFYFCALNKATIKAIKIAVIAISQQQVRRVLTVFASNLKKNKKFSTCHGDVTPFAASSFCIAAPVVIPHAAAHAKRTLSTPPSYSCRDAAYIAHRHAVFHSPDKPPLLRGPIQTNALPSPGEHLPHSASHLVRISETQQRHICGASAIAFQRGRGGCG